MTGGEAAIRWMRRTSGLKPCSYQSEDGRWEILPEVGGSCWELVEVTDEGGLAHATHWTVREAKDDAERLAHNPGGPRRETKG